jgi:hypothetical protein
MGMSGPLTERSGRNNGRFFLGRIPLSEEISEFWRDLQKDHAWKYQESSPNQILEGCELQVQFADDEMVRASWFWSRRPRLLHEHSLLIWLLIAVAPVSLVLFHIFGLPLLIVAAAVTQVGIVRTARWRRDYELSIDRLIRDAKSGGDTFGHHLPS